MIELRKACEHGKYDECGVPLFTYKTRRLAAYCPGGLAADHEDLKDALGSQFVVMRAVNEYSQLRPQS